MTTRYKNVQIYVDPKDHKLAEKIINKKKLTTFKSLSEFHRHAERQLVELYEAGAFNNSYKKVKSLNIPSLRSE